MDDTKIGGSNDQFPRTRWSAIVAARSEDRAERSRAFEALAAVYWKPVYKYLRLKWRGEIDQIDQRPDIYALGAILSFLLNTSGKVGLAQRLLFINLPSDCERV